MARFVLGDLHGARKALVQVLERSGFDKEHDKLIFVGDAVDGWPESRECINELLTIKNRVILLGNHDEWFWTWVRTGGVIYEWVTQGGRATADSYGGVWNHKEVPDSHRKYLEDAVLWHQEDNKIFVHGGWRWRSINHPVAESPDILTWDRDMWWTAYDRWRNSGTEPLTKYEVFLGHTSVTRFGFDKPQCCCGIWNMDTGAAWEGKLSLMNIDTYEVFQSDQVSSLYPEHNGRWRC